MSEDKSHMAILNESPPYMPIAYEDREIWAILVGLGYYHVKLIKYEKGVQVVFTHKPWLKSEGSNVEKAEVIDLRWAMEELPLGVALPLVKKMYAEFKKEQNKAKVPIHNELCRLVKKAYAEFMKEQKV